MGPYGDQWSVFNGAAFLPNRTAATSGAIAVINTSATGTNYTWRLNGVAKGGVAGTGNPALLNLGAGGAYNEPWFGVIYEMLIYNSVLTDYSGVETYLMTKYGMI